MPYVRVPPNEVNIAFGSANIERIIRYWQLRGTAVWLIEIPGGRVGHEGGRAQPQGSLFSPSGRVLRRARSWTSAVLVLAHCRSNRYWRELFVDSVHPRQPASALTTALMVRELRFQERILAKAEGAELGRGVLPNGALLVPQRTAQPPGMCRRRRGCQRVMAETVHPSVE